MDVTFKTTERSAKTIENSQRKNNDDRPKS